MTKREKYSWIYWLCVLLLFIGLQRLLFPNTQGPIELTYSEFLDSVRAGKVQRIVFLPEKIIGYLGTKDTIQGNITQAPTAPWRVRIPSVEQQVQKQFIVYRIPNMNEEYLLSELREYGVNFKGHLKTKRCKISY